jgi:hypothetical protein
VSESGAERLLIERLEQLGGRVETGCPFVDFAEESHCLARLGADAGECIGLEFSDS